MSGNYPPGVTGAEDYFNPPDHSHEHEWEAVEGQFPIFEDGAAIFQLDCRYAEGRYGEGWKCPECRTYRCELTKITKIKSPQPNISIVQSAFGTFEGLVDEVLEKVFHADKRGELEILDLDPANEAGDGFVRVKVDGLVVEYQQ